MISRRKFIKVTAPAALAAFILYKTQLSLDLNAVKFLEQDKKNGFISFEKYTLPLTLYYKGWGQNKLVADSLYTFYLENTLFFHGLNYNKEGLPFYYEDPDLDEVI